MCRRGVLALLGVGLVFFWVPPLVAEEASQDTPFGNLPVSSGSTEASDRTVVPMVELTPEMQARAQARLDELRATAKPLSKAVFVVDDFEDGDLDGWTGPEPSCNAWVDFIGADGTDRSLRIDGASTHFGGMSYDMGPGTPDGMFLYVRPGSTSTLDTYVVFSDAASYGTVGAIFFLADDTGRFVAVSDVSYDCGPYSAGVWYELGFNIDWKCEAYDVYINDTLKQFNIPLREYFDVKPDNIQFIDLYNWRYSTAWWDQVWGSTLGFSNMIFSDGFERGSTCGWSSTVG